MIILILYFVSVCVWDRVNNAEATIIIIIIIS